jgi:hypothetical protein
MRDDDPLRGTRERIQSATLRKLYDYWEEKRGERQFPARHDLDPLEFRFALGNIVLVDVEHAPMRFRFRLVGTEVVKYEGVDPTGKYLDELHLAELRQMLDGAYRDAVAARVPVHNVRERFLDGRMRRFEVLDLPLSADGDTIDMLMIGVSFPQASRFGR